MKNITLILILAFIIPSFWNCRRYDKTVTNQNNSLTELIINVPVLRIKHHEFASIIEQIAKYEKENVEANQRASNLCFAINVNRNIDTCIYIEVVSNPSILFYILNPRKHLIGVIDINGYDFFCFDTLDLKISSFVEHTAIQKSYTYSNEQQQFAMEEFDVWVFKIKGDSLKLKDSYL